MTRDYQSANPQIDRNTFAVAAQRLSPRTHGADDFPSPPWIARALIEYGLPEGMRAALAKQICLEPAAGRGYMAEALRPYFRKVRVGDAYDYGYVPVRDFLTHDYGAVAWVTTNPPFRLAREFIIRALEVSRVGVAMFARTQFLEGQKRYDTLFSETPTIRVAQFAERIRIVEGRLAARWSARPRQHANGLCVVHLQKEPHRQRHQGYLDSAVPKGDGTAR